MGRAASKPLLLSEANGDAKLFKDQFVIDHKLGEGEFGVVNLIREKTPSDESSNVVLACKVLQKGVVFRDNTLFTPLKPEILQRECNILRVLQGQHYTLILRALFESKSVVYIVTEYCAGGMMMDYLAACYGSTGLSTSDMSRISFQLLDAVAHCAACGVTHRDIKVGGTMFILISNSRKCTHS
jgi:serine/threonine protein kinase